MERIRTTGPQDQPAIAAATTERGVRTRRALINAALDAMAAGRSFNSLSIREITRQVGIVPTAFYRHFQDMDELGLAMVEDCTTSLRRELRQIRQNSRSSKDIIRDSFLTYMRYVEEHPKYFLVASGERHGGSPVIREAIRRDLELFSREMAEDTEALNLFPDLSAATLLNVSRMVIDTTLSAASEILDLPPGNRRLRKQMADAYVQQLRILFLGASQWHDREEQAAKKPRRTPR